MVELRELLWDFLSIVTALLVVVYAYYKWSFLYWKRRNIPYFEPSIPFGNFLNIWKRDEAFGDWSRRIYEKGRSKGYKYFGIYLLSSPVLVLADLELTKNVMTRDFNTFINRGVYTNAKDDPLSDHLFSTTGKKWRNLRIKLTPTFTSGKLKAMFQTLIDCGSILEKYIENVADTNKAVDIKDVLGCYSTDIIGSCAFGLDCNSFKEPNSPFRVFGKRIFTTTGFESMKNLFSDNFPNIARALHICGTPRDAATFFQKTVEDTVAYRTKNDYVRKDFLQLLIDLKNKNGQNNEHTGDGNTLTMDELSAQSFVFFVAGFETSSSTATFTLYLLATHPKIQDKLRENIREVLNRHNGEITYDSLSEMKYMGQVINESLRIYPPGHLLQRIALEDYKIPGEDTVIEKGTKILIPIYGYHHDKEYFSNPEVFDPDRFSEENKKNIPQYSFMPFGEGPRNCIGERFGKMQAKVALTSILKNFRVTLNEKTKLPLKMDPISDAILSIEGGMWLNFEKI